MRSILKSPENCRNLYTTRGNWITVSAPSFVFFSKPMTLAYFSLRLITTLGYIKRRMSNLPYRIVSPNTQANIATRGGTARNDTCDPCKTAKKRVTTPQFSSPSAYTELTIAVVWASSERQRDVPAVRGERPYVHPHRDRSLGIILLYSVGWRDRLSRVRHYYYCAVSSCNLQRIFIKQCVQYWYMYIYNRYVD